MALSAGHLMRRPLHRGAEKALVAGHHGLPGGCHRVGRGPHVWQRDLCASGYSGSMTDERGHKICNHINTASATVNISQHNNAAVVQIVLKYYAYVATVLEYFLTPLQFRTISRFFKHVIKYNLLLYCRFNYPTLGGHFIRYNLMQFNTTALLRYLHEV